jgi:hypothetical protein
MVPASELVGAGLVMAAIVVLALPGRRVFVALRLLLQRARPRRMLEVRSAEK